MKARVCQNPENPLVHCLVLFLRLTRQWFLLRCKLRCWWGLKLHSRSVIHEALTHQRLCHWLTERPIWERRPIASPSKTLCFSLKAFKKFNHPFLQGILQQHLWPTRTFCGYFFLSTAGVQCTFFILSQTIECRHRCPIDNPPCSFSICLEGSLFEI